MKRLTATGVLALALLTFPDPAEARKRVTVRTPRARVTVRAGFPIHRTLPHVVVRPAPVVRITPRVYLPAVAFTAATVAVLPSRNARVWEESEELEREDGWTDFTMSVDERGNRLLMQIENGSAQISFAEVVFDNGEAQVVDFDERVYARGVYSLLDFANGRKVDHVRIVARAASAETDVALHLVR